MSYSTLYFIGWMIIGTIIIWIAFDAMFYRGRNTPMWFFWLVIPVMFLYPEFAPNASYAKLENQWFNPHPAKTWQTWPSSNKVGSISKWRPQLAGN